MLEHVERLLRLASGDLQFRLFGCGQRTDVFRRLVTGWTSERLFRLFRIPQQSIAGGQMQIDLPSQRIVFAQLTKDTLELFGGQRQGRDSVIAAGWIAQGLIAESTCQLESHVVLQGEQFVAGQRARLRGTIGRVGDDAGQLLIEFFEGAIGLPDAGARLVQRRGRFGGDFGFESRQFAFGQGGQGVLQLHQDAARIRGLLG